MAQVELATPGRAGGVSPLFESQQGADAVRSPVPLLLFEQVSKWYGTVLALNQVTPCWTMPKNWSTRPVRVPPRTLKRNLNLAPGATVPVTATMRVGEIQLGSCSGLAWRAG